MKGKSASWARWVAGATREPTKPATESEIEDFNQLRNHLLMFLEAAVEVADSFKRGRRQDAVTRSWCHSVVAVLERQGIQLRDMRGRARPQTNKLIYELWRLIPPQKLPRPRRGRCRSFSSGCWTSARRRRRKSELIRQINVRRKKPVVLQDFCAATGCGS